MSTDATTQEKQKSSKSKKDQAVEVRRISFDGLMKAADEQVVVGLSRVSIWRMEREKKFPARVQLSPSRVGWIGSEVREWINARPRVDLERCESESEEAVST